MLCCSVFVRLGLPEPFDIVLIPQQWFLYSKFFIWARFTVLLTEDVDTFFTALVLLCCDIWSSHLSVTQADDSDKSVLCPCGFWCTSPTFGLVLSCFLMSPNYIIHRSSGNFYFLKSFSSWISFFYNEEKRFRINFSKDIWLYLGQSQWERHVFSKIDNNTEVLNLFH